MKTIQPTTYSTADSETNVLLYDSIRNNRTADLSIPQTNHSFLVNSNPIVDSICSKLLQLIYDDSLTKTCYSKILSRSLSYHYTYLSNLFTSIKGTTIQQFIIYHKIERVKKLLIHPQSSLTEIAYILNYSSVAHLSNQFKKVTGLSPSQYKVARLTIVEDNTK